MDGFAESATLFTPDHNGIGPPAVQRTGGVLMRVGDQNRDDLPTDSNEDSVVEIGMWASLLRGG